MPVSSAIRIVVAALAAFVFSALYYGLIVGSAWHDLSGVSADTFAPWQPIAQIIRNLVVAGALSLILRYTAAVGVWASLRIAAVLWLGFQVMAIAGSVIHENYPVTLLGIHAFDALMALVVMTICLTFARGRESVSPNQ